MHSDSCSVESNSDKGEDEIELEKLKVYKPELIEADEAKKYSDYDEVYKEEKKSLATEENVLDEKAIPLVVIEDQSERIITSRLHLGLFISLHVGYFFMFFFCRLLTFKKIF